MNSARAPWMARVAKRATETRVEYIVSDVQRMEQGAQGGFMWAVAGGEAGARRDVAGRGDGCGEGCGEVGALLCGEGSS